MNQNKKVVSKKVSQLFKPSWLIITSGIVIGAVTTAAVIALSHYRSSDLRRQIFDARNVSQPAIAGGSFDSVTNFVANNHILGIAPLFVVWAGVGLVIYFFATSIARSVSDVASLRDEINYVHISRRMLIREELRLAIVRIGTVVVWFIFIKLSVGLIIPYALALANISAQSSLLSGAGYALGSVVVLSLDVYVHAVFARLLLSTPMLLQD